VFSGYDKNVPMAPKKNSAAVKLGSKGGKATAKNRTAKERSDAARKAVNARWEKERKKQEVTAPLEKKRVESKSVTV
jgi:hypothetical protein